MQFEAPSGYPLGTNKTFKIASKFLIPLLKLLTKRDWRGVNNIPKSGPVIVISNHISYADALVFTHYLFANGRAVRYLGKDSVFKIPVIGWIIKSAARSLTLPPGLFPSNLKSKVTRGLGLIFWARTKGVLPTKDSRLG